MKLTACLTAMALACALAAGAAQAGEPPLNPPPEGFTANRGLFLHFVPRSDFSLFLHRTTSSTPLLDR